MTRTEPIGARSNQLRPDVEDLGTDRGSRMLDDRASELDDRGSELDDRGSELDDRGSELDGRVVALGDVVDEAKRAQGLEGKRPLPQH